MKEYTTEVKLAVLGRFSDSKNHNFLKNYFTELIIDTTTTVHSDIAYAQMLITPNTITTSSLPHSPLRCQMSWPVLLLVSRCTGALSVLSPSELGSRSALRSGDGPRVWSSSNTNLNSNSPSSQPEPGAAPIPATGEIKPVNSAIPFSVDVENSGNLPHDESECYSETPKRTEINFPSSSISFEFDLDCPRYGTLWAEYRICVKHFSYHSYCTGSYQSLISLYITFPIALFQLTWRR